MYSIICIYECFFSSPFVHTAAQVDFEAMEEAHFEASSPLLLQNEPLIEAPELIQNNLSNENFRYSHQNSSLVQDTTVSKSKERSPESQKQHKSSKIVDSYFFSKGKLYG
jgi:hypothetical protein